MHDGSLEPTSWLKPRMTGEMGASSASSALIATFPSTVCIMRPLLYTVAKIVPRSPICPSVTLSACSFAVASVIWHE